MKQLPTWLPVNLQRGVGSHLINCPCINMELLYQLKVSLVITVRRTVFSHRFFSRPLRSLVVWPGTGLQEGGGRTVVLDLGLTSGLVLVSDAGRMQQGYASHKSAASLTALTQEIERKLEKASSSHNQRSVLLQGLFADIALEVDVRAKDIIINDEGISPIDAGMKSKCLSFYDVLADHYTREPEDGKHALELIVQLWSQSFASNIFVLLFHKWLFEVSIDNSDTLLRYSSALVQGATNIFWIDIQTNTRRFSSLFCYLLEEVSVVPERLVKIPLQARRDLFLVVSRFIFFYNLDDKLHDFLKYFPTFPNAFLVGGPGDFLVIELADQLQKLKVEPVLLHYLSHMGALQGLELRMTTSTRLKACLYSFTSPGGPMYPTRAVRHAAWDALDFLFPVGRYPRHVISLFFRLMYPWYWPSSCWNFIMSCLKTILYSILRLIFSGWENMRRPKNA